MTVSCQPMSAKVTFYMRNIQRLLRIVMGRYTDTLCLDSICWVIWSTSHCRAAPLQQQGSIHSCSNSDKIVQLNQRFCWCLMLCERVLSVSLLMTFCCRVVYLRTASLPARLFLLVSESWWNDAQKKTTSCLFLFRTVRRKGNRFIALVACRSTSTEVLSLLWMAACGHPCPSTHWLKWHASGD